VHLAGLLLQLVLAGWWLSLFISLLDIFSKYVLSQVIKNSHNQITEIFATSS
jgi:hypothetical protein